MVSLRTIRRFGWAVLCGFLFVATGRVDGGIVTQSVAFDSQSAGMPELLFSQANPANAPLTSVELSIEVDFHTISKSVYNDPSVDDSLYGQPQDILAGGEAHAHVDYGIGSWTDQVGADSYGVAPSVSINPGDTAAVTASEVTVSFDTTFTAAEAAQWPFASGPNSTPEQFLLYVDPYAVMYLSPQAFVPTGIDQGVSMTYSGVATVTYDYDLANPEPSTLALAATAALVGLAVGWCRRTHAR